MKKVFNPNIEGGQKQTSDPRRIEEIVNDFLEHSNSPFAVTFRRLRAEDEAQQQAKQARQAAKQAEQKQQAAKQAEKQAKQKQQAKQAEAYQQAHGRHSNTELCVDLKTQLLNDAVMKAGKPYRGVLTKVSEIDDLYCDEFFKFFEDAPQAVHRNPRVFDGKHVTITRWPDGSYRANLKPVVISDGFDIIGYATSVGNELMWALEDLIENV